MTSTFAFLLCLTTFLCVFLYKTESFDPTDGFESLPLSESNFKVQKPYNVPQNKRYNFKDGVHRLWVFKTDKPHFPASQTKPRTEIRIQGYEFSAGVWQFEGEGYVPQGTSGACIMQVFGASGGHASTLMIRTYNGNLSYYKDPVIYHDVFNKWFTLNVIHDVDAGKVMVYINGDLKYQGDGRGGDSHYFKFGVYAQENDSDYMESRWKNIKIFKKK